MDVTCALETCGKSWQFGDFYYNKMFCSKAHADISAQRKRRDQAQAKRAKQKRFCKNAECKLPITKRKGTLFCSDYCCHRVRDLKRQADRRAATKPLRICALEDCTNSWKPNHYRDDKSFCSPACSKASSDRLNRERIRKRERARKKAVLGRVCRYCEDTDKRTDFASERVCVRCDRQKIRSFCARCKGPFYKFKHANKHRVEGCVVKYRIPLGFDCRDEVGLD